MSTYLVGIERKAVDEFQRTHRLIKANVSLHWGKEDKTKPLHLARDMISQISSPCELDMIPRAFLIPQKQRTAEVFNSIDSFLRKDHQAAADLIRHTLAPRPAKLHSAQ